MRPSWLQDGCRPPKRKNRWRSPISIMFHERMGAKIQVFLVKFLFIPNPKSRPKSRPLIHQIWRGSMAGSSRKSVLLGIGTQKKNTTCTSFLGLSTGENPKKNRWKHGPYPLPIPHVYGPGVDHLEIGKPTQNPSAIQTSVLRYIVCARVKQ